MTNPLIITGMSRSATSFVASLLQGAGLDVGTRLLAPTADNVRGYFEDLDFVEFHSSALISHGQSFPPTGNFVFSPAPQETDTAKNLINNRGNKIKWGWKDPRTSFFLDFWLDLLPDAKFLFLYRYPLEVLWSLVRRGEPLLDPKIGIGHWIDHNWRIHDFAKRHRGSCLLVHCWGLPDHLADFTAGIQRIGFDLDLTSTKLSELWHPNELEQLNLSAEFQSAFENICPQAIALYNNLEQLATIASPPHSSQSKPIEIPQQLLELAKLSKAENTSWLLQALLTSIDPVRYETGRQRSAKFISDLILARDWLEHQRQQNLKSFEDYAKQIQQQRTWIAELEQGKTWLEEQLTNWKNLAEARQLVIRDQQAWLTQLEQNKTWIAELEQGKIWLEAQLDNWQRLAEDRDHQIKAQEEQITQLEQARTWLETQQSNWQKLAETRQQSLQEQQAWIAELEQAKVWLTQQETNWRELAQSREQTIAELQAWIVELEKGKTWLEEQWHTWQLIAKQQNPKL